MPIVQAYQCPRTAKLFLDKNLYILHLKFLAKENRRNAKEARLLRSHDKSLQEMRNTVRTIPELCDWITTNSDVFYMNKKIHGYDPDKHKGPRSGFGKIHSIKFGDLVYKDVSNIHNAPIGKPINWYREDDLPKSYPGWSGRMKFHCDECLGFMSDMFKATGINIGNGGGGSGHASYDIVLFKDDWPGLALTAMLNKLAGGSENEIDHLRI